MSTEERNLEIATAEYQAGRNAFERGEYRKAVECLEQARSRVMPNSRLGGEVQIWLVTAYEAAGKHTEARALCKQVSQHPHYETRQQGKRLLYILEAPKLATRPEWLTQIPDLNALEENATKSIGERKSPAQSPAKPSYQLEPVDLSQVNSQDNRFIWVALILAGLIISSLLWLS